MRDKAVLLKVSGVERDGLKGWALREGLSVSNLLRRELGLRLAGWSPGDDVPAVVEVEQVSLEDRVRVLSANGLTPLAARQVALGELRDR